MKLDPSLDDPGESSVRRGRILMLERDRTARSDVNIFRHYKGQRYEAVLHPNNEVTFRGRPMTPSAAAMEVTNNNVNGWRWWKYRPTSTSTDALIDGLRSGGLT